MGEECGAGAFASLYKALDLIPKTTKRNKKRKERKGILLGAAEVGFSKLEEGN